MKAINITTHTEDTSQIGAIKSFKIKYAISNVDDSSESLYDPEFLAMIKQGEQDLKDGKGITTTLHELEKLSK
jgi:hypothetical protein